MRFVPLSQKRIAVIKSRNLGPINLAWAGFHVACGQYTTPYDTYDLPSNGSDTKDIIDRIIANRHTLVLAIGSLAARVARAEIHDTPIVYVMDSSPHNPDQHHINITGISLHIPIVTQLATYQSLLPTLQSIGVIYDPKKTGTMVTQAEDVAQSPGLRLHTAAVTSPEEVPDALRRPLGTIDALWMLPDDTVVNLESFQFLALTALEHRLPLLAFSDAFVEAGALAALSPDYLVAQVAVPALHTQTLGNRLLYRAIAPVVTPSTPLSPRQQNLKTAILLLSPDSSDTPYPESSPIKLGSVHLVLSPATMHANIHTTLITGIGIVLAIALPGVVAAFVFYNYTLTPVQAMAKAATDIAAGDVTKSACSP